MTYTAPTLIGWLHIIDLSFSWQLKQRKVHYFLIMQILDHIRISKSHWKELEFVITCIDCWIGYDI